MEPANEPPTQALGAHWVRFQDGQWEHGIQTDARTIVTWVLDDHGQGRAVRLPLNLFSKATHAYQVPHPSRLSPTRTVQRVQKVIDGSVEKDFGDSSEFFALWCCLGTRQNPERQRARQLERELATLDIQSPNWKAAIQALGVYDSEDQVAVARRILLPGMTLVDSLELLTHWAKNQVVRGVVDTADDWKHDESKGSPSVPLDDRATKFARAAGASAMGLALGGPISALQTWLQCMRESATDDHSINRTKHWVRETMNPSQETGEGN